MTLQTIAPAKFSGGERRIIQLVVASVIALTAGAGGHASWSMHTSSEHESRLAVLESQLHGVTEQLQRIDMKLDRVIESRTHAAKP